MPNAKKKTRLQTPKVDVYLFNQLVKSSVMCLAIAEELYKAVIEEKYELNNKAINLSEELDNMNIIRDHLLRGIERRREYHLMSLFGPIRKLQRPFAAISKIGRVLENFKGALMEVRSLNRRQSKEGRKTKIVYADDELWKSKQQLGRFASDLLDYSNLLAMQIRIFRTKEHIKSPDVIDLIDTTKEKPTHPLTLDPIIWHSKAIDLAELLGDLWSLNYIFTEIHDLQPFFNLVEQYFIDKQGKQIRNLRVQYHQLEKRQKGRKFKINKEAERKEP